MLTKIPYEHLFKNSEFTSVQVKSIYKVRLGKLVTIIYRITELKAYFHNNNVIVLVLTNTLTNTSSEHFHFWKCFDPQTKTNKYRISVAPAVL